MTDKRQSKTQLQILQIKYLMVREHTSEEKALLTLCWCHNIPNSVARNLRQVTNPPKKHFDTCVNIVTEQARNPTGLPRVWMT